MGKIFVTSDTHFGHDREFIYKPRGFDNVEQMNEEIVKRWNEVVGPDDTVYHLGDVMLGDKEVGMKYLKQLNGNIKIAIGNHDTDARISLYQTLDNVEVIGYATLIKYKKHRFYLSHYPTLSSNLDDGSSLKERVLNLYGHTHQVSNFYNDSPFMYHVGMDSHNCYPVDLDKVIEDMRVKVDECVMFLGENKDEEV